MTSSGAEVHIFWRTDERSAFTYAGIGNPTEVSDETPVKIRWSFKSDALSAHRDTRSKERLPADVLESVTPEHVWRAVQLLLDGYSKHQFSPSTDYDLIADNGIRLAPKAVFGVAARLALGFEVLPKHFTAGEDSLSFKLLRHAGYVIVKKDEPTPSQPQELSSEDQVWAEGKTKLVTHLVKERARGLAQAKKSQFKHKHGRLYCEKCGLDPVAHYKTIHAESCIEVHHHDTHVSQMKDRHETTLDDLQCLCANCHRLVHRALRDNENGM